MKKIIMLVFPIIAFLGGAFAGDMFAPPPPEAEDHEEHITDETSGEMAWMRFPSQFFIPIMRQGNVQDVMILALTLEMPKEAEEDIFRQEHRLRDALLRQLMIHANTGGFDGNFTAQARIDGLKRDLLQAARRVAGENVSAVLVEDIARQGVQG